MLIAGHETTSTTLSWLFWDLAKPEYQHIQDKLREELLGFPGEEPTMDELNALPYLDAVVRENSRKNCVVEQTIRVPVRDTRIPVSKPYLDRDGKERTEIE